MPDPTEPQPGSNTRDQLAEHLSDRVVIVLVRPLQPGNVGAVARAMRNMGLRRLVVVDAPTFDIDKARWMAPGAMMILDEARYVADVATAVADCHHVVATTARGRHHHWPAAEPEATAAAMFDRPGTTAILFGPEDAGLLNEDLAHAHSLLHIATDSHASLNLGQAALLVASAIFGEARRRGYYPVAEGTGRRGGPARGAAPVATRPRVGVTAAEREPLIGEWMDSVRMAGYMRNHEELLVAGTLRQILERADLDAQEVVVLRGMFRKMRWKMKHPDPG